MHGLGSLFLFREQRGSIADHVAITGFCRFIAFDDCLNVGNLIVLSELQFFFFTFDIAMPLARLREH